MAQTDARREYLRVWQAKWRASNPEAFRAYRREHYAKHRTRINSLRRATRDPEKHRAKAKARYEANQGHIRAREKKRRERADLREKARVAAAKWRQEHRDRHLASLKRYQQANPHIVLKCQATRRARKKGAFVEAVDPSVVFRRDKGQCGICMESVNPDSKWHIDHIMPLSRGGAHSYDNVQLAHAKCNQLKRDKIPAGQIGLFQVSAA